MVSKVGIFWDYENCHPSSSLSGCQVANNIRKVALNFGVVTSFKAYLDVSLEGPKALAFQAQLHASGVSLIHCPHDSRKDVVDRALSIDMLVFALESPPPATVIIITGDRDYANAISTVEMRGHRVVLIMPSLTAHANLKENADIKLYWTDVLEWQTEETIDPIPTQTAYTPTAEWMAEEIICSTRARIEDTPIVAPSLSTPWPVANTSRKMRDLESSFSDASEDTEIAEISRPSSRENESLLNIELKLLLMQLKDRSIPGFSCTTSGLSNPTFPTEPSIATSDPSVLPPCTSRSLQPQIQGMFEVLVKVMRKGEYFNGRTILFVDLVQLLQTADPKYCKGYGGAKKYVLKARESHIVLISGSDKGTKFSVELCPSVISTTNGAPTSTAASAAQTGNSKFVDLVDVLKALRSINDFQPTYSVVGILLLKRNPHAYKNVGCSRLKRYLEMAQEANLVELGANWVRLRSSTSS